MGLAEIVQSLTEMPDDLLADYVTVTATDEIPPEALAVVLVAIRECRMQLASLSSTIERDLLQIMPKKLIVAGVGEVEAKRTSSRTAWDYETLIPAIVGRVADEPGMFFDPEDGTQLPYQTIGHNIARRLRECVSFSGGKVTGLRALGIDPSEYCHETWGDAQVKLPARQLP